MNNIIKCTRCKKTLIEEEFNGHVCTPNLRGIKDILVDYYYLGQKDNDGHEFVYAKGLDGILYRLVKCLHKTPHQPSVNTENTNHEDNSTIRSLL